MSDYNLRPEKAHAMLGVPGLMFALHRPPQPWKPSVFASQKWVSQARPIKGYGSGATLKVDVRFDDDCRNGHNTFAITAEVTEPKRRDCAACGCLHDDIAKVFPELAPLTRWHLVSTDGPMYYIANTLYLAGDADHNGLRKGESKPLLAAGKIPWWQLVAVDPESGVTSPLYKIVKDSKGEYPPRITPRLEWRQQMVTGEGKARELDAARRTACWPEATDAELSAPRAQLQAALLARLPALLEAFRQDMESCGFMWASPEASSPTLGSGA